MLQCHVILVSQMYISTKNAIYRNSHSLGLEHFKHVGMHVKSLNYVNFLPLVLFVIFNFQTEFPIFKIFNYIPRFS